MRLLDRILEGTSRSTSLTTGLTFDWYADQLHKFFTYQGLTYPISGMTSTLDGSHEEIEHSYEGYVESAYKRNGIVFACEALRTRVFSEARYAWVRREQGRPQELFTDASLATLERPWPGGTIQDLQQRLLLYTDFGGNGYATINRHGHVRLLRPDWMTIVRGSDIDDPDDDPHGIDAQLLGYIYKPGGPRSSSEPEPLLPNEVAHLALDPDPVAMYRGMSWMTPLLREIAGDSAMTMHKNKFLENAATPNLIVRMDASVTPAQFDEFKKRAEEKHAGIWNAWKTMYLGGGADVTVAGANFQELDFKLVQGHGETRIAAAAGIHPVVVGFSEGMQGSSLNAGNYSQARRNVADTTFHPMWRNAAGTLETMLRRTATNRGAELAPDLRDVPFLRQDAKDEADIQRRKAATISTLISAGFTPESAISAVETGDFGQLEHTGLVSVQLQPPGANGDGDGDGSSGDGDRSLVLPWPQALELVDRGWRPIAVVAGDGSRRPLPALPKGKDAR